MREKLLKKFICLLIATTFIIQIVPINVTALTNDDASIIGNDSSETKDSQRDTYAKSFTALVNGILSNDTGAYRRAEKVPYKGGVWISNSASERMLSLFNDYSDNTYSMNSDGYLTLEVAKSKPSNSLTAFYGDKINELIQSEKTVILSIESTYNSVSEYDESVMHMTMEKGDFALLFSQDDGLDVVVLNSYNYVDNPDECHDVELLNKLLDVFYHNDEEFQHFSTNVPQDAVAMFTSKQSSAHSYAIIQDDEIICNANDAMTEYDIALSGVFNSSINDINAFSEVANDFASQPGIYIEAKSQEHFLDYLNQHGIYTYSVDENGKLLCDKEMKRNPNFDFQSETEVDLQMEYTMQMGLHFTVAVDDSYYTIDNGIIVKKCFKQDEFIRAFSNEDKSKRVLILNSAVFYKDMEINWPASDRFVKAVVDTANSPSTMETGYGVGTMVSAQTVYAGPSSNNYFTVGSVSASEVVYVLFKTVGWYYISYAVGQTGKTKMGFVPVQTATIISSIQIPEKKFDGQFAYTNANVSVKSTDEVEYALDVGTIYAGEGFTYLYLADYSMVYVEFSTPSGTKRGYVPRTSVANTNYTSTIGRVSSVSTGVYSGPDSSYVKLGGAYLNEYVCLLEEKGGWYLVEYNTPSGRKRGFSSVRDYEKQSYRNLPSSTNTSDLKKSIGSLTVYGGPNSNYANIGSIFDQEIVAQLGTEREYSYIEYTTSMGAKRGYVLKNALVSSALPTLPNVSEYSGFIKGTYGISGQGEQLNWYRIGNGTNVAFAVFEQHGWEDKWAADGAELIKLADSVMKSFSTANQSLFNNWSLYIIPYANPDGITHGYTNNGIGRCTSTNRVDMNRCWPANFIPQYSSRNYTGANALNAPEASALKDFLSSRMTGAGQKILLDIHGWLNKTYGSPEIGSYFNQQFGFSNSNTYGSGYLATWAKNQGARASLVELPIPANAQSIVNNNYSGKLFNAMYNMLSGIPGGGGEEGGQDVNEPCVVTTTSSVRVRSGPGTGYDIVTSLTNGTNVTRVKRTVATANGYVWDKILLSDGRVGYMATNYLTLLTAPAFPGYQIQGLYPEMVAVKAYLRCEIDLYQDGPFDSSYNNELVDAVEEYTKRKGLPATGELTKQVLEAMGFSCDSSGQIIQNAYYTMYHTTIANAYINESILHKDKVPEAAARDYVFGARESFQDINYWDKKEQEDALYNTMSEAERNEKDKILDDTMTKLQDTCKSFENNKTFKEAYQAINRYVENTGEGFKFDSIRTIFDINQQSKRLKQYQKDCMEAAELFDLGQSNYRFAMKFTENCQIAPMDGGISFLNSVNWFLACNYFKLGNNVEVSKNGNKYTAILELTETDYYYWDDDEQNWPVISGIIPQFIKEREVRDLHTAGMARNYVTTGTCKYKLVWNKGDDFSKAAITEI